MQVVFDPNQVTPQWLTEVFNAQGIAGQVKDVTWQSIGAGQVGENARFTLQADGDIPASVVGKFPSFDPTSKQTGVQLLNYAREVFFYREIAETVDVCTPHVYTTEFDPSTHDFVVLMEDLAPGIQIDQMAECTVDQAAVALEELAKLHGPRWGDASLAQVELLSQPGTDPDMPPIYQLVQDGYLERYAGRLAENDVDVVRRFGEVIPSYAGYEGAQTLIHIDYRLDNMIYNGPYPLAILDWQSINLGCALNDASYFMGTSFSPENRRKSERDLMKLYHEVLSSYDVDLPWDECWDLYCRYAPAGLHMAVVASMIVGETPRGNDMFMTMASRSVAMCEDLESLKRLSA